jgi:hypothetical protein
MTHLYFHCAAPGEVLIDARGTSVSDLSEAREHAATVARFIMDGAFGVEDFSEWQIYVGNDEDDEVLVLPFAAVLPTLH